MTTEKDGVVVLPERITKLSRKELEAEIAELEVLGTQLEVPYAQIKYKEEKKDTNILGEDNYAVYYAR